jgi:hypothetical protein
MPSAILQLAASIALRGGTPSLHASRARRPSVGHRFARDVRTFGTGGPLPRSPQASPCEAWVGLGRFSHRSARGLRRLAWRAHCARTSALQRSLTLPEPLGRVTPRAPAATECATADPRPHPTAALPAAVAVPQTPATECRHGAGHRHRLREKSAHGRATRRSAQSDSYRVCPFAASHPADSRTHAAPSSTG